jgi:hypothetical protein
MFGSRVQLRASQAVDAIDAAHAQTGAPTVAEDYRVVRMPSVQHGARRFVAAIEQLALFDDRVNADV